MMFKLTKLTTFVCCFGSTLFLLVAAGPSWGAGPVTQAISADDLNNTETIEQLGKCPAAVDSISYNVCNTREVSCRQRCGQVINLQDINLETIYCSCDALCEVYKDCCWDYHDICAAEQADQSVRWKPLLGADVVCEDNYALIASCYDADGNFLSNHDVREQIVSEVDSNLHFRNKHIYSCYKNRLGLQNMTTWSSVLIGDMLKPLLSNLNDYLYTGNASNDLRAHLFNKPPHWLHVRDCYDYATITCEDDMPCSYFRQSNVVNFSLVCNTVSQKFNIGTTGLTTTMMTSAVPMYLYYDDYEGVYQPLCTPWVPVSKVRDSFLSGFSVVMAFDNDVGVSRVELIDDLFFESVLCPENLFEKKGSCQFQVKCTNGFIFLYPQCFHPEQFRIVSETATDIEAAAISERIIEELENVNNGDTFLLSLEKTTTYLTNTGWCGLNQTFNMGGYQMEHSGRMGLDFGRHLIEAFSQGSENRTWMTGIITTRICFSSRIQFGNPNIVCDNIIINGTLASVDDHLESLQQNETNDELSNGSGPAIFLPRSASSVVICSITISYLTRL